LCALAVGEQRQGPVQDQGPEVIAGLMGGEGGLIGEQFVEEELRLIFFRTGDLEQPDPGFGLRLRQEPIQYFCMTWSPGMTGESAAWAGTSRYQWN
jgi:hypothetical protein